MKKFDNILNDYALEIYNKNYNELEFAQQANVANYMNDIKNPKWKKVIIDGKESKYSISNIGNFRNDITGKILSPYIINSGYKSIKVDIGNNKRKAFLIHRLVAETFIPNPENKPQVNHISGVKTCNWVGNLEWTTREENMQHASRNKLLNPRYGETSPFAKNSNESIHKLCKMLEEGNKDYTYLSLVTSVPYNTIMQIIGRRKWLSISSQYNIPYFEPKRDKEIDNKILELIHQGYKCKEIINNLKLPNTDANQLWINRRIKKFNESKDKASTTIPLAG